MRIHPLKPFDLLCLMVFFAGCNLSTAPECVSGMTMCTSDIRGDGLLYICNDKTGQWGIPMACGTACADGYTCGENRVIPGCDENVPAQCTDTDAGGVVITCNSGMQTVEFCGFAVPCQGNQCPQDVATSCKDGDESYCVITDNYTFSVGCEKEKWQVRYCSKDETCKDGVCTPKCHEGDPECVDEPDCEADEKKCELVEDQYYEFVCEDKQWKKTACKAGYVCGQTQCVECLGDSKKCEVVEGVATQYTCKDGKWDIKPCGEESHCEGDKCVEKAECENNSKKCDVVNGIGYASVCTDGRWVKTKCNFGVGCKGNVCGECIEGLHLCSNEGSGYQFVCKNGDFVGEAPCTHGCTNGLCLNCEEGTTQSCESGVQKDCINGEYYYTNCGPNGCDDATHRCKDEHGCSDGTREGYRDLSRFPNIAACNGAWNMPGTNHNEGPVCNRKAGNSGENKKGTGCNVEDLCAEGWHVCLGAADYTVNSGGDGCMHLFDDLPDAPEHRVDPAFYLTRESAKSAQLAPESAGLDNLRDDLTGCGNLGRNITSSALNVSSHDLCTTIDTSIYSEECCKKTSDGVTCDKAYCKFYWYHTAYSDRYTNYYPGMYYTLANAVYYDRAWSCGNNSNAEAGNVVKLVPEQGGVLCCRNQCETDADCCGGTDECDRKCFYHTCKPKCNSHEDCKTVNYENAGITDIESKCFENACSI